MKFGLTSKMANLSLSKYYYFNYLIEYFLLIIYFNSDQIEDEKRVPSLVRSFRNLSLNFDWHLLIKFPVHFIHI